MKTLLILLGLCSFVLAAALGPVIIPLLKKLKARQTEREDGPESHKSKTGTPTMGAFIFLIPFFAVSIYFAIVDSGVRPILFLTLAFAVVGFMDDFIKVVLKRSEGLTPIQKFGLQIIAALVYVVWSYMHEGLSFTALIPFVVGKTITIGWIGIPILMFIILGTVNGSNFTDGVDGLEATVTAALCVFFMAISIEQGKSELAGPTIVMFGALIGFLIYNVSKAQVFMGDTGSLALGGFVAAYAHSLNLELYLPMIAIIYFAEVVSVILQVLYFKKTGGKRLFRMAPIHHHFELGGWTETKVVGVFTIVTIIACAVTFIFT